MHSVGMSGSHLRRSIAVNKLSIAASSSHYAGRKTVLSMGLWLDLSLVGVLTVSGETGNVENTALRVCGIV